MATRRLPVGRLIAALAGAVLWSAGCGAQVYKWVDEKGVTNYSSTPPASGKAKSIDLKVASVSVYEAPPPQQAARALEAAMRARMERLEDELLAERRARQTSAHAESDRRQLAYEQCLRDRRVDCDLVRDGLYTANAYSPYYVTAWPVLAAARPFPPPRVMPVVPPPAVVGAFGTFGSFGTVAQFQGGPPRPAGHSGSRGPSGSGGLSRQGR